MRFSTHTARAVQRDLKNAYTRYKETNSNARGCIELIRLLTYLKKAINQTDNCTA